MLVSTTRWTEKGGWSLPLQHEDADALTIVFGGRGAQVQAGLRDLRFHRKASSLCGCSSAGEILDAELTDDGLVVATLRPEKSRFRVSSIPLESGASSILAGRAIGEGLLSDDLRGILIFSDGLAVNGSDLVRGVRQSLPPHVLITGGLAADGPRFEETWTLVQGEAKPRHVTAVGLYGDALQLGASSRGGWDLFGPERTITKSNGNELLELDGRSCLELYKEYLGERAAELPASALRFPLAISAPSSEATVVRTILSVNEQRGSLTFAGDMPVGYSARLMRANLERLIGGAEAAARDLRAAEAPANSALAIAISCVGRRIVLGERAEEEVEATLSALPMGTRQLGFYSYGEISPSGIRNCELHNQTMTLTSIAEATL
jgi:hypothetical protein